MSLLTTTLTTLFNQIAKSIQLSTLIPATILVLCNMVFVFPALNLGIGANIPEIGLLILTAITISYLLWQLNGPFIKLVEGYSFKDTRVGQWMIGRQDRKLRLIEKNLRESKNGIEEADNWLENVLALEYYGKRSAMVEDPRYHRVTAIKQNWEIIYLENLEVLRNHFPSEKHRLLPTEVGNTLAAFEQYSQKRYGIDSISVWPRMVPILGKNGFASYVEREKASFDFLVNLLVMLVILSLEFIGLSLLQLSAKWLLWLVITVPMAYLAFKTLTTNALYWGDMVKVAFDLFRHDLREALLFRTPDSLEEEKQIWEEISAFIAGNEPPQRQFMDYGLLHRRQDNRSPRNA